MESTVHEEQLAKWREAYEAGNSLALLLAIRMCISLGIPPPSWAATAFSAAVMSVATSSTASWDDAFGRPPRAPAVDDRLALKVWMRIEQLREARPAPRDPIADLAAELGVDKAEVKRLHREGARLVEAAVDDLAKSRAGAP